MSDASIFILAKNEEFNHGHFIVPTAKEVIAEAVSAVGAM